MKVRRLRLKNFRNYEFLDQKIDHQVNFFLGLNGSGKTNFIEAIYCCLHGNSFRTSKIDNLISKKSDNIGYVELHIEIKNVVKIIKFQIQGNRKTLKVDDKASSSLKNSSEFPSILFSPESLSIIKAGPQERRELVDQITLSLNPARRKLLQDFAKALRTRNRVLKNILEFPEAKNSHLRVLESLNPGYLELAALVTSSRIDTLRELIPELKKTSKIIFKNQMLTTSMEYLISSESAIDWSSKQVYDALVLRHQQLQGNEQAAGQSLVGPHKHDISFVFEGQNAKEFCSQGQQRSLVLTLKIAQVSLLKAKRNIQPLLLLDDVFSELDKERRESLFKILGEVNAQIFLTNVNDFQEELFKDLMQKVFLVEEGKVKEN